MESVKKGIKTLRSALVESAHSASSSKKTYYNSLYWRISKRRGRNRATVAVAHSMLIACYYVLLRKEPYKELGPDYYDLRAKGRIAHNAVNRLKMLGYDVLLKPIEQVG